MQSSTTTKRLTDAQRIDIYIRMSLLKANGRIKHGELKKVCDEFKVTKGALAKIWKRACETREVDGMVDVRSMIKANSGRPRKLNMAELEARIKGAPAFQRSTLRSLAILSDHFDNGCQFQDEADLSNVDSIYSQLVGVELVSDE
ncbi:hypothetical protein H310_15276 [Aphanomyces invadans]|uniref:Uncharacterized protein n=1 Tax=Aphanomyces invadans TaxID=157072 RepID=A0A024T7R3_9STRA|nr:hypothetical protein H310_15276 [Aphanomyces invadans]ETV89884.1 hypothetical protein H310_15276 [Aphanomyces invadans]|eukprot:XP_008881484.1 hypothetical protein H310_15276 [Aphanomyces invadans]